MMMANSATVASVLLLLHDPLNQVGKCAAALFEEKERCRDRQLNKHGDKHSKPHSIDI